MLATPDAASASSTGGFTDEHRGRHDQYSRAHSFRKVLQIPGHQIRSTACTGHFEEHRIIEIGQIQATWSRRSRITRLLKEIAQVRHRLFLEAELRYGCPGTARQRLGGPCSSQSIWMGASRADQPGSRLCNASLPDGQSDLRDKDPKDNESLQSISRSYALSNFPCRKHQDSWMACECTSENLGALHSELHTVILDR